MTKTALSLTPKEVEAYCRAAALIKPKRRKTVKARRTRAWQVARKVARILKADFGVEKVIVFGSLLHPALFHERSDVDLIAFEEARPALQGVILREGRGL